MAADIDPQWAPGARTASTALSSTLAWELVLHSQTFTLYKRGLGKRASVAGGRACSCPWAASRPKQHLTEKFPASAIRMPHVMSLTVASPITIQDPAGPSRISLAPSLSPKPKPNPTRTPRPHYTCLGLCQPAFLRCFHGPLPFRVPACPPALVTSHCSQVRSVRYQILPGTGPVVSGGFE